MKTQKLEKTIDCPMFRRIATLIRNSSTEEAFEENTALLIDMADKWAQISFLEGRLEGVQRALERIKQGSVADEERDDAADEESLQEYFKRIIVDHITNKFGEDRNTDAFLNGRLTWKKLDAACDLDLPSISEDLGVTFDVPALKKLGALTLPKMLGALETMYLVQHTADEEDDDDYDVDDDYEDEDEEDVEPIVMTKKAKKSRKTS